MSVISIYGTPFIEGLTYFLFYFLSLNYIVKFISGFFDELVHFKVLPTQFIYYQLRLGINLLIGGPAIFHHFAITVSEDIMQGISLNMLIFWHAEILNNFGFTLTKVCCLRFVFHVFCDIYASKSIAFNFICRISNFFRSVV